MRSPLLSMLMPFLFLLLHACDTAGDPLDNTLLPTPDIELPATNEANELECKVYVGITQCELLWYSPDPNYLFDITLNDTLCIASNLKPTTHGTTHSGYFNISGLDSNKTYKLQVRGNKNFEHICQYTTEFSTQLAFYDKSYCFNIPDTYRYITLLKVAAEGEELFAFGKAICKNEWVTFSMIADRNLNVKSLQNHTDSDPITIVDLPDGNWLHLNEVSVEKRTRLGESIWSTKLENESDYIFHDALLLADESILVVGYNTTYKNGYVQKTEYLFTKIASDGTPIWTKTFGEGLDSRAKKIFALENGNFLVVGTKDIDRNNPNQAILIIDAEANLLKEQVIEYRLEYIDAKSIVRLADKRICIIGSYYDYRLYYLSVVHIDDELNVLKDDKIDLVGGSFQIKSFKQIDNNRFMMAVENYDSYNYLYEMQFDGTIIRRKITATPMPHISNFEPWGIDQWLITYQNGCYQIINPEGNQ